MRSFAMLQGDVDKQAKRVEELGEAVQKAREAQAQLAQSDADKQRRIEQLDRQVASQTDKLAAANRTIESQAEQLEVLAQLC